jgi:membrane protease subunit HflC
MTRNAIAALAAAFVVLVVVLTLLFEVDQTEQALVVQLGQPVRVIQQPGLHAKLPFVQSVIPFDRRLLDYSVPAEEVILGDQRRLIVDSFTRYRIVDPLRYYQSAGVGDEAIQARLNSVVSSSLRRVLGNEQLLNVLSSQRARIMKLIRDQANHEMQGFGITVEDVRIRRADLPEENTQAVLARMQSERVRVAKQARAEGAEAATKIRADADRQRTVLLAQAKAKAEELRGEGEARAIQIYAAAAGQDPQFFGTWRTLQAYRAAFAAGASKLVLTPGDDFLHLLTHAPRQGAEAAATAAAGPAAPAAASGIP